MYRYILFLLLFPAVCGAQTWQLVQTDVNNILWDVFFVSEDIGWVCGDDSTIMKTTDGGYTWVQQQGGVLANYYSLFFLDENHGWVTFADAVGADDNGGVIATTDGGTHWRRLTAAPKDGLFDVQFLNLDVGWVVGYGDEGVIARTTDGGVTWENRWNGPNYDFQGLCFLSEKEGYAVGGWTTADIFSEEAIYHTDDGGKNWESRDAPVRSGPLLDVTILADGFGMAGGWGGTIITYDSGVTWDYVPPRNLSAMYVLNHDHLYGIQNNGGSSTPYFSKDTGRSWDLFKIDDLDYASGMQMLGPRKGWIVGLDGKVWVLGEFPNHIPPQFHANSPRVLVYPNPISKLNSGAASITILLSSRIDKPSILIHDILGYRYTLNYTSNVVHSMTHISIPIKNLGTGVYYFTIKDMKARGRINSGVFILSK